MMMLRFEVVACVFAFLRLSSGQDRIIFPDDNEMGGNRKTLIPLRIPEKLLIQLKDVHNTTDLIQRFVVPHKKPQVEPALIFPLNMGKERTPSRLFPKLSHSPRRKYKPIVNGTSLDPIHHLTGKGRTPLKAPASPPVHGYCKPLQTIVELESPGHGAVYLFPSCVVVKRCAGCCTSQLLTCTPVKTSSITVAVTQLVYNYNPDFPDAFDEHSIRSFTLEQHDQCVCKCTVQPEDCGPQQMYRPDECQCICKNHHQIAQCTSPKKVWDKADCACKCRQVLDCSTGFQFHPRKCRCERIKSNLAALNATTLNSSLTSITDTRPNLNNMSRSVSLNARD